MDNMILDFLASDQVRIEYGWRWMVVKKVDTGYIMTVREQSPWTYVYVLYEGAELDTALQFLKGEYL